MVGKADQHASLQSIGRNRLVADVQALFCGDPQELLEQRPDLARRLRVNAHPSATVDVVAILLGVAPGAHQHKKIRRRLGAEQLVARLFSLASFLAHEQVAPLRERGDQRDGAHAAIIAAGQQHARIARVHGKREHAPSERGDGARGVVDGSQVGEQRLGAGQRKRVGRLQPAKCFHVVHPARFERQYRLREIQPFHFREVPGGTRALIVRRP